MFAAFYTNAQINAVAEEGEQVILNDDRSWIYLDREEEPDKEIPTNPKKFEIVKNSTFLLKSTVCNMGIWINPKKWRFTKSEDDEASEYSFEK